ncbi:tol-pal system protein YbgF [Arhodomonas sp. AD133]|uniref:tol-pal system protein YbgF n=1 Tax=Arhodomonas sp. AD133 TaxID=3415009 RepID=UPI003EBD6D5B
MKAMTLTRQLTGSALAALLLASALPATAQSQESLERRLTVLERKLDSGTLTRMLNQFSTLQQEVQRLNGRIGELQRRIEELEKRQRSMYSDLDNRLLQLEQGGATAGGSMGGGTMSGSSSSSGGTIPGTTTPGATPPGDMPDTGTTPPDAPASGGTGASGSTPSDTARADNGTDTTQSPGTGSQTGSTAGRGNVYAEYQSAFDTLSAGRYQEAAQAFRNFLDRHPRGEYADNARYWLGETHYVVREFDQALDQFNRVLNDYPNSAKRPDALLKIGYIHYENGQLGQARQSLRKVVDQYPDSSAASLARQRLEQIGG